MDDDLKQYLKLLDEIAILKDHKQLLEILNQLDEIIRENELIRASIDDYFY